MIPWPFLAFTVIFCLIVYLHFFLGHREWRKPKGQQATEIDTDYVLTEDFLGQSFRVKVKEWLQAPHTNGSGADGHYIDRGQERIRVNGQVHYRSGSSADEVLVVEQDFSCDPDCTFSREIYVRQDATIGTGSRLQSIAVDGKLKLLPSVSVARWVDSTGQMEIGRGCTVLGRVTSRTAIQFGPRAEAGSVSAPEVATLERQDLANGLPLSADALEIPLPAASPDSAAHSKHLGLDPKKLFRLSSDCWLYKGDLELAVPLRLKTKLVVKGECFFPAGSVLEHDVKTTGSLTIGPGSLCRGNLVAGGSIHLGARSQFHGVIHAGKSLWLCWGVRGSREEGPVAAFATNFLFVENNVVIKGKLASGGRVIAVPGVPSELLGVIDAHRAEVSPTFSLV